MVTVTYSCSLRCHLPEENKTDKELFLNNIQIIFLFWCFTKISQGSPPPPQKKKKKKKKKKDCTWSAGGANFPPMKKLTWQMTQRIHVCAKTQIWNFSRKNFNIWRRINPFTPKILLVILLTVCYTILIPGSMSWENFCIGSTNSHLIDIFQNFSSLVWLILYLWHKEKFCFIHLYHTLRDIKLICV